MSFLIKDEKVSHKHKSIWDKISNIMEKGLIKIFLIRKMSEHYGKIPWW